MNNKEQNKKITTFNINKSYKLNDMYSNLLNFYNNLTEFECCICFSEEFIDMCPISCKHLICEQCMIECVFNNHHNCPLCRQPIQPMYNIDFTFCTKKPLNILKNSNNLLNFINFKTLNIKKYTNIFKELGKTVIFKANKEDLYIFLVPQLQGKQIYKFKSIALRYHIRNMISKLKANNFNFWFNDSYTLFYLKNLDIDYFDFV